MIDHDEVRTLGDPVVPRQDRATRSEPPVAGVVDLDLAAPDEGIARFRDQAAAVVAEEWVLVRFFDEPIGLVKIDLAAGLPDDLTILATLRDACADRLAPRLTALGLDTLPLPPDRMRSDTASPFLGTRRRVLEAAEHITVVICTRERPTALRRALQSLAAQSHPDFDVLVVDNAPSTTAVADVVAEMAAHLRIRRVVERRPGLSRARNRALAEIRSGIVAWIDDDEVADQHWLAEIARGFAAHPEASAVCGVVVPAELRTRPQLWFEQFGGHSKGRGFVSAVFSRTTWRHQHPLYPLPTFGVGANMAFRSAALQAIGGFDEALGAGTPTKAGEDTKAISQVLLRGDTVVYQHSALTRHYHRDSLAGLDEQLTGYGIGLSAFYLSMIMESPARLITLARLAPRAFRDMTGGARTDLADISADFPRELLRRNVRGMAIGAWRYLCTRWAQRREIHPIAPNGRVARR